MLQAQPKRPPKYRASCPSNIAPRFTIRNRPRPVHVRAKIAAGKRVNSKITMTVADEIRASTLSERVLAEKFGVHPSMVGRIRRGDNWLRYDGALGQLMRAA